MLSTHKTKLVRVFGLLLVLAHGTVLSATINVPADQPTIQAGINAAVTGDTVLVDDGVYTGEGNRGIDFGGKNIVLRSRGGPEVTIIDCEQAGRGFHIHSGEDSTARIEGFTIASGMGVSGNRGGGILCENSSPTILDCVFGDNTVYCPWWCFAYGGAVCAVDCSLWINSCTFQNNHISNGIPDWEAWGGAVAALRGDLVIDSCLFFGNRSDRGGAVFGLAGTSITLRNCTFVGNRSIEGGGSVLALGSFAVSGTSSAIIENCIAAFNLNYPTVRLHDDSAGATFSCTNIFGNEVGDWMFGIADQAEINGNFSLDPQFCDTASFDLTLNPLSACLPVNNSCQVLVGALGEGCDCCVHRGDINHDGSSAIDVADLVHLVDFMFTAGDAPPCKEESDVDGSGTIDISDLVYLVDYMFNGGPAPVPCP